MAMVYGKHSRNSYVGHSRRAQPKSPTRTAEQNMQLCMDLVIDLTALNVEFDYSCLDGLDEQLILRPFDAFADACYTDAVYDLPPEEPEELEEVMEHQDTQHLESDFNGRVDINIAASPQTDSDGVSLNSFQDHGSDVYTFDSRHKEDYEVVTLERPPQKLSLVQLHHLIHIDDDGESFLQFRERYLKMNGIVDDSDGSFPPTHYQRRRTFGDPIETNYKSSRQPSRLVKTQSTS